MANHYFYAGLDDADIALDPSAVVDDVQATNALTAEETLAAQQQAAQAAAALAAQELLAQQAIPLRHHHMWQRLNGTTFRTRIGTWQDMKAQRLAAAGRLVRVSGAVMTGYAGDLQYRVINPHGAVMRWRDGSLMPNVRPIAPGTVILGTPRGDGYTVEVSSGGMSGWLNALDLEQLSSADPVTSGEFAGADGEPGAMMPATGCPGGQVWSEWYGRCIPYIPPPPPSPVSSVRASGEYVGDGGMMPATGCPAGTSWSDYYGKCIANIPPPPPPMPLPDTFEQWRQQHQTSGEFTGYGWEYEVTGAAAGTDAPVQLVDPTPPSAATHPLGATSPGHAQSATPPLGQAASAASVDHPAIPPNAPPAAHAAAHAADANVHAQAAQAIAAHPAAPGTGAENHAEKSFQHASQATEHAHAAAQDPHRAHLHAHAAAHHTHMAARHASHLRREGHERGWHGEGAPRGIFGNLFGQPWQHQHGFSRNVHAHPEWHRFGHPAWRGGIHPMWANHRAECAHRSGPRGIFGFLFGWNRRYCAIERIHHPMGLMSYRVTPAGLQEGILLEDDMVAQNQQFETQAGQVAPDADAGPMPGSDDKASGAIEPDHTDDDDTGDEGGADDAADAVATATTGHFAGWSQENFADERGRGGRSGGRRNAGRGAMERQAYDQGMMGQGMGMGQQQQPFGFGEEEDGGWHMPWHHHRHHHHQEQHQEHHQEHQEPMMPMGQPPMPPMPPMPPQPHQTWLYGGGTTNPYDPNAQHPLGVTEGY